MSNVHLVQDVYGAGASTDPLFTDPTDAVQIGTFLAASFDPSRGMLGATQYRQPLRQLKGAQQSGVLWKFVVVPEPIRNPGPAAASACSAARSACTSGWTTARWSTRNSNPARTSKRS